MIATYPEAPGFKVGSPDTSRRSAKAMEPSAQTLRDRCFWALKEAPMTADEVAELMGATVLAVRPRVNELSAMGMIREHYDDEINELK